MPPDAVPEFEPEAPAPWFRHRRVKALLAVGALIGLPLLWATQPMVRRPVTLQGRDVDPRALEQDVRRLVEGFPGRGDAHPEALERAAAWLESRFREAKARVSLQRYSVNGQTYLNVRAYYGPEEGERIVVGAHYDACDGLPGADDNASGVAGLLALARIFADQPPAKPVELAAYTLEEPPHFRKPTMGSAIHVAALVHDRIPVRAMVCLEMLGTYEDGAGTQRYPLPGLGLVYPDQGNFIAVVGDSLSPRLVRKVKGAMAADAALPVWSINAPAFLTGVDFSDHRSYWAAGIPAVMVTDTAFFRNPRYHTARDTPDRLDYRRMAEVVKGVHAAVLALQNP